jgi:hypothetical protein
MKKNLIALFIFVALVADQASAQLGAWNTNYFKKEELQNAVKRPLLVVEYNEAKAEISKLEQKLAKAKSDKKAELQDEIDELKIWDKEYSSYMLEVVKQVWKHNDLSEVKVITHDEAKKMKKEKNNKFTLLMLRSFGKSNSEYDGSNFPGLKLELPIFVIQPSEDYGRTVNLIGFPLLFVTEKSRISKQSLTTNLLILNRFVDAALAAPKKLDLYDWIKQETAANCKSYGDFKLHFNESALDGDKAIAATKASSSDVVMESSAEFSQSFSSATNDLFAIYYPTQISETSISIITTQAMIIGRVIVQPSTGKIFGFAHIKTGEKPGKLYYKAGHVEDVLECGKK